MYKENEEKDQDRVADAFDHFERWGYVMFPENEHIYREISKRLGYVTVLDVGCGVGVGTNLLNQYTIEDVSGVDKIEKNANFASALYPGLKFKQWDISMCPNDVQVDVVVSVEAIEHIKDYKIAMKNLIASAKKELWISTPNRLRSNEMQPSNPYHVREWSPQEFIDLIEVADVRVLDYETFREVPMGSRKNPLVYHIRL
jgi:2-polyprenyl-3-methyl-5-hydroxy-6-metoxy-1,4-benzoquinol methylase